MYNHLLHRTLNEALRNSGLDVFGEDNLFYVRAVANIDALHSLFTEIYPEEKSKPFFNDVIDAIIAAYKERPASMRRRDEVKADLGHWFLSNSIAGMSLYVDRFCGKIGQLENKLDYFQELGVNLLHLMPIFESPEGESDGGYAVSDFRKVDQRFGSIDELRKLREKMDEKAMYLMLDIVLNHTSHRHSWAEQAKAGKKKYQEYYYMYDDRKAPDEFEKTMPEIFPESSPGNFTFNKETGKWVMTVFHHYQWDLNYRNPEVFREMLSNIFFFANLGVDVLRIDAPAFIWKQQGTTCQNLPEAHTLLRLIKLCLQVAAPGMAILGEAIVAPKEIMKYFGTGHYLARECDFAYNATHMALQWDMLATGDTRVMLAAQHEILQKPYGTTWITYTRCHDDIGLGYEDYMIQQAGYDPVQHRKFLKDYYSGAFEGSMATGALFSFNPKTGDARISGSLASLCGLEKALTHGNNESVELAARKILLMQAHSFFLGGVPMLFYGDEVGYTNDYSYLQEPGKSYDNRWMHRPVIDWAKNNRRSQIDTLEHRVFSSTKKLLALRSATHPVADIKNLTWLNTQNHHVAGYLRTAGDAKLYCFFNFSEQSRAIPHRVFNEHGHINKILHNLWTGKELAVGSDEERLTLGACEFLILESR